MSIINSGPMTYSTRTDGPTYSTRTDGPTYSTRTDGPTYAKIIGNNHGSYPYRVGLNTLMGEVFDPRPECGPGGLYYCELKNICDWLGYGDRLCIVEPVGQIVKVGSKFKTDRLEIVEMMDLREVDTWKFIIKEVGEKELDLPQALGWAARNKHFDLIKFLIEEGTPLEHINDHVLQVAIECGRLDIVELLIKFGGYIPPTVLPWTAMYGRLEIMEFLVAKGANARADGNYALRLAAKSGHLEIMKFLVAKGADLAICKLGNVIELAIDGGHVDVVNYLAENGIIKCAKDALERCRIKRHMMSSETLAERGLRSMFAQGL